MSTSSHEVDGGEEEGSRRKRRSVLAAAVDATKPDLPTSVTATCAWEMTTVRCHHGGAKDVETT
jgi:hypothetical protein